MIRRYMRSVRRTDMHEEERNNDRRNSRQANLGLPSSLRLGMQLPGPCSHARWPSANVRCESRSGQAKTRLQFLISHHGDAVSCRVLIPVNLRRDLLRRGRAVEIQHCGSEDGKHISVQFFFFVFRFSFSFFSRPPFPKHQYPKPLSN